jgi:hypothetical protein
VLLQYLSGREGWLAPALVFLFSEQKKSGGKPPFLTLRLPSPRSLFEDLLTRHYRLNQTCLRGRLVLHFAKREFIKPDGTGIKGAGIECGVNRSGRRFKTELKVFPFTAQFHDVEVFSN